MEYKPDPIDVSSVKLTPELEALTESLAKNAHDNWALARMNQGWTFGQARDDDQKLHPCLIPYDQLSESEKDLDRVTSLGTIKAIIALGYRIVPPDP